MHTTVTFNSSTVHIKINFMTYTRWFKYDRDDLCVNKSQVVLVIFEPPCISDLCPHTKQVCWKIWL
jgi:hypothetical protein